MKTIDIYTDGACSGNPGIGGWAAILMYNEHKMEISGFSKETTNNRMEMFGVLQALKQLKQQCIVNIYSDSAYVVNAFNNGWVNAWQKSGWKKKDGELKNVDLWKALVNELALHKVTFIKVKGHSDNFYNNRCDELARGAIENYRKSATI